MNLTFKTLAFLSFISYSPFTIKAQMKNFDPLGKREVFRSSSYAGSSLQTKIKSAEQGDGSNSDLQLQILEINLLRRERINLISAREDLLTTMVGMNNRDEFKTKKNEIEEINNKIKAVEKEIDTFRESIKTSWRSQRVKVNIFNKNNNDQIWEEIVGKGTNLLPNLGVLGSSDRGVIYSELATDALFDVIHVSFGTVLAAINDEVTQDEKNITRLLAGGGNAVLDMSLPLSYHRGKNGSTFFTLGGRLAGDSPALGNALDKAAGNASLYLDFYSEFSSLNRVLNFFVYLKASTYTGSDSFYKNLNLPNNQFEVGQLNLGITINQTFRISALIPLFSTYGNIVRQPVLIGAQLINNQ